MYQTYNVKANSYGVIYAKLSTACEMAKLHSAIFRCPYFVVDTETGEIMAQYDYGFTMYKV